MATNHLSVMIEAIGYEAAMKVKTALDFAGYSISLTHDPRLQPKKLEPVKEK